MGDIKGNLKDIQQTCQNIKEHVPVALQEVVNGEIVALTDAISFVSFAFTFMVLLKLVRIKQVQMRHQLERKA